MSARVRRLACSITRVPVSSRKQRISIHRLLRAERRPGRPSLRIFPAYCLRGRESAPHRFRQAHPPKEHRFLERLLLLIAIAGLFFNTLTSPLMTSGLCNKFQGLLLAFLRVNSFCLPYFFLIHHPSYVHTVMLIKLNLTHVSYTPGPSPDYLSSYLMSLHAQHALPSERHGNIYKGCREA